MTHVEDLLADASGTMVRRLVEGARAARKRALQRNETRFGLYLHGPEHNGDSEAGRQVGHLTLPVDDTGEVSADQICRSFIDAQRRAFRDTGPLRGTLELRFLSDPGREELSSTRTWEDVVWGDRDELDLEGYDAEEGFMHDDDEDDHGITPAEDELGLVHQSRGRGESFAVARESDFQRNLKLGFHQRDLVKDIERDSLVMRLFEQVTEGRRHEQEMTRSALAFQRSVAIKCLDAALGGGGGGGRRGGGGDDESSPARGMKLVADAMSFFKTMQGAAPQRRGGGNQNRAGRLDNPNAARPAVPPAAFEETAWDNGGFSGGRGGAVDRVLAAKSAGDLNDRPPSRQVPAIREPRAVAGPVDVDALIAGMDDAQLIHAVRDRISDIAGAHAPLVDGFLGNKLDELEGGDDDDGYDYDDDLP